ncbi:hypothetical protein, partial [Salipiger marinus]|uniref:hypothetical protein n=1 Tax=Salipiger marinus TaxID=555512 RepID=UPI001A976D0A
MYLSWKFSGVTQQLRTASKAVVRASHEEVGIRCIVIALGHRGLFSWNAVRNLLISIGTTFWNIAPQAIVLTWFSVVLSGAPL